MWVARTVPGAPRGCGEIVSGLHAALRDRDIRQGMKHATRVGFAIPFISLLVLLHLARRCYAQ